MIQISLLSLLLLNYAYVGILPRIFFRGDGRYNLMWFVTAGPLFMNAVVLLLGYLGFIPGEAWIFNSNVQSVLPAILSGISVGLISYTLGTHRIPLALWHQKNDAPVNIVTWGAYKRIRHPFYSSFILVQLASVIAYPHIITLIGFVWCVAILNATAAKEERKLSQSDLGDEYKAYMPQAGRFIPKF
ncbi:MAG: methyltransferase family protein [Bdellovibrio sp.]